MVIYKITNQINGKIYIGQTVRALEERMRQHKRNSKTAIDRALHKYGAENFSVEVIDTAETPEELNAKEIAWIASYNSMAPNGYNLCKGGESTSGFKHREESKRKMAIAKAEIFRGEGNPFSGCRTLWNPVRK